MGKCKDRTKKFFKGMMRVISPLLIHSGATLAGTLATHVAAGAISSHEKRKIMVAHLKQVAKEEGNQLEEYMARAVNEYIYKNIVVDHLTPDELTDIENDVADMDPEQPELA